MSNLYDQAFDEREFPPGTVRLADKAADHLVLAPQPTSDPNDPLNWSTRRKTIQMTLLSLYSIFVFSFLTISPPLWYDINSELGISYSLLNDSYGVSAATLSVGCIIFTPFALRYGRRPVYIVTSLLLFGANIWSARIENVADIMLTNVIMGAAGSVNETLFQMTVNDLFFVYQRGTLNGLLFLCSNVGNYLAPVAGGYVAIGQDWRWAFWYLAIFQGVVSLLLILFLEETKYIPDANAGVSVPISTHEQRRSVVGLDADSRPGSEDEKKLGKPGEEKAAPVDLRHGSVVSVRYDPETAEIKSRLIDIDHSIPIRPKKRRYALYTGQGAQKVDYEWWRHLVQPFIMLYTFPAVAFTALTWAFCLSALSLIAVSTSDIYPYPPYNFSPAGVGNFNIPPAIGSILGTIWGGPCVDWALVQLSKRNNGIYEPEMRLTLFTVPAVLMPVGVFMFGLCTARGYHWIIPAVGSAFVGFAISAGGDIALVYIQDAYTEILPDSLIGVAFVRNIMACILVFAIGPWFDGMGVYGAFVLLGCISVAFSLLGIPMYFYGKWCRWKRADKYRYYAAKQFVLRTL